MRGHFEVYPDHRGYRWRFIDEAGRELACSSETYRTAGAAKAAAGEFVLAIRTSTYGQRRAGEIADAVIEAPLAR